MIGVEPEIIKRGIANSIGVLVLRERFAGPGDGAAALIHCPRHTAVALIIKCAIIGPTGFLRRRMKSDVTDVSTWPQRHTKRLDSSVQVLVIQGILIVPDARSWIGHLVTHKPDAIVSRVGLDLIDRGARDRPSRDGRSHPHGSTNGRK